MHLVSVIVPSYNCEKYIQSTLESICAQSYKKIEIIVIDDGSTDNTNNVIHNMCKNNKTIRLLRQENSGQASARNYGICESQGDFIAFCDADDLWVPTKLEQQMPLFSNSTTGVVYCDMHVLDDKTQSEISFNRSTGMEMKRGKVLSHLLRDNFVAHSGMVVRKTCFAKAGKFNSDIKYSDDWDMLLRLAAYFKFDYVPEKLIWYRANRVGQISTNRLKRLYSKNTIFCTFKQSYGHLLNQTDIRIFQKTQNKSYAFYYRSEKPFRAIAFYLKALLCDSGDLKLYRSLFITLFICFFSLIQYFVKKKID